MIRTALLLTMLLLAAGEGTSQLVGLRSPTLSPTQIRSVVSNGGLVDRVALDALLTEAERAARK